MMQSSAEILIVDDQIENLQALTALLSSQGYQVRKAISGEMALDTINVKPPDLILLDVRMPHMSGYEVCSQLKKLPKTSELPVIFLSASNDTADKVKGFAFGGADYITKPFQAEEVLARVAHQLMIQQQKQQLLNKNQQLQEQEIILRQQRDREQLLSTMLHRIRQSLQLDEILGTAVSEVRQLLEADRVLIYRLHPDGGGEVVTESVKEDNLSLLGYVIGDRCFENYWYEIYRQGCITTIEDIYTSNRKPCHIEMLARFQVRANLVIPLLQRDKLWGLLTIHDCTASRKWQEWEIQLIKQLATQLAIAIEQAELHQRLKTLNQELERLAYLDGLTEVANRRYFNQFLPQIWEKMAQNQTPLSLILCDVDYFKLYNDYYGHLAGDQCLRQIAMTLAANTRRLHDFVARYGGEEFALLLPNTDIQAATGVARRLQQAIANLQIPHARSPLNNIVTASFGIANIVPTVLSLSDSLIDTADRALYRAKELGRNTYHVAA